MIEHDFETIGSAVSEHSANLSGPDKGKILWLRFCNPSPINGTFNEIYQTWETLESHIWVVHVCIFSSFVNAQLVGDFTWQMRTMEVMGGGVSVLLDVSDAPIFYISAIFLLGFYFFFLGPIFYFSSELVYCPLRSD